MTSAHRLGFAVKVLAGGGLPSHDTRRWQSGPHLRHSLEALRRILDHLERHDIRMYRMATALAPYASHPELPSSTPSCGTARPSWRRSGRSPASATSACRRIPASTPCSTRSART